MAIPPAEPDASQPSRTFPGLSNDLPKEAIAGKKKGAISGQTQGGTNGQPGAVATAAHFASLMHTSPSHDQVNESVQVQPADLAKEVDRQTTSNVTDVPERKNGNNSANGQNGADDKQEGGVLLQSIHKRIKTLSKKLQKATVYSEKPESELNADMKRIIASKGNLEGAVAELSEMLKAIEISEKQRRNQQSSVERALTAKLTEEAAQEHAKKLGTLFELMHLHSLMNTSMQSSFAPPPMPPVLQSATSQQIAAVGKLFADLSASMEVKKAAEKSSQLDKLVARSADVILDGITYEDVSSIIEGSGSSSVQKMSVQNIMFLQASELDEPAEAETSVEPTPEPATLTGQIELEGEAVDNVETETASGSVAAKGLADGRGVVVSEESGSLVRKQDGRAKTAVEGPARTTEIAALNVPAFVSERSAAAAPPKVIDWSATDNDDDFGDLEMQPETNKSASSAASAPTAVQGSDDVAITPDVSSNKKSVRLSQQRQTFGQQRDNARPPSRSKPSSRQRLSAAPTSAKPTPQVDEDGFMVASSKRTKMIQQQAAQGQTHRGRGRGNYRGGHVEGRGGVGLSGVRGRGRGRGAIPTVGDLS